MIDSAVLPAALLPRLRAVGVDTDAVLVTCAIAAERFGDPKVRVSTAEMMAFWRAVEQHGAPPDMGLRLASERRDDEYDMASLVAVHAATFREALQRLARYKRIVCPENVELTETGDEAQLRFHWLLADAPMPALFVDGMFASALAIARRGIGKRVTAKRLELSRRRQNEAMLRAHFGCAVRFDAPVDLLILDRRMLDEPLLTQDTSVSARLVPELEATLVSDDISDRVRLALLKRMSGDRPSVERLATDLHLSSRTLQRKLGDIGTTYQKLLDDVRHGAARRMLSDTDLDVSEIAFLLGFEEENSLARAFHAWEGTTPRAYRLSRASDAQLAQSARSARAHSG
jgi:AraC-like DNA-binding protein